MTMVGCEVDEVLSPSGEEVLEAVVSVSEDELVLLSVFVLVCSCGVDGVPVIQKKQICHVDNESMLSEMHYFQYTSK